MTIINNNEQKIIFPQSFARKVILIKISKTVKKMAQQ